MTALKTGKLPAVYDPGSLHYGAYATAVPVPAAVKAPTGVNWGMLGNDTAGDCVWAGADHEVILWNHDAKRIVTFTDADALADYGAVTGYPQAGDNGTNVLDALKYRRKIGTVDAVGHRHLLGAYVAIEPGHQAHVQQAVYDLGAVGIGIEFPVSAMDQFNAGKPWSVVAGAQIDGGHYIPVVGYDHTYAYVVTWGKVQPVTWGFFAKYCDEAYGLLSSEFLKGGKSPAGFNLAQLQADLKAVAG